MERVAPPTPSPTQGTTPTPTAAANYPTMSPTPHTVAFSWVTKYTDAHTCGDAYKINSPAQLSAGDGSQCVGACQATCDAEAACSAIRVVYAAGGAAIPLN